MHIRVRHPCRTTHGRPDDEGCSVASLGRARGMETDRGQLETPEAKRLVVNVPAFQARVEAQLHRDRRVETKEDEQSVTIRPEIRPDRVRSKWVVKLKTFTGP